MITITKTHKDSNWISGKTSDGLTFEARVFEEPSPYGMSTPNFEGGNNVSSLYIRNANEKIVFEYDRGGDPWDTNADDLAPEQLAELVMYLEYTFMK